MNSRTVRIIGIIGILWNLVGVASYLAHVGMFGPEAAATPPGSPPMPIYITAAFAIAVFGGVLGSAGLAIFKSWAKPVLWLAFVTSVINWTWVFMYGVGASMPLGVSVIAISLGLAVVASRASLTKG
ncbi:hypothetical protein [Sphingorhabdus sp.]|uniref:hypothetical protein n=1 Tax=Sphingorhabdus sp. TaxID=1902408 RepID=UPI003593D8CD